jgi:putative nucleotidyltransferase with HDIG domain
VSFEKIEKVAQEIEGLLVKSRYSDARTLHRIQNLGLPFLHPYLIQTTEARVIPIVFWKKVKEHLSIEFDDDKVIDFILPFFEKHTWQLLQDVSLQRTLRDAVQEKLPVKTTRVAAGSSIVEPGERVTARHVAMLLAMKDALTKKQWSWEITNLLGSLCIAAIATLLSAFYLFRYHPILYRSVQKLALFVAIVLLTFILDKAVSHALPLLGTFFVEISRYPLLVPLATLLTSILVGWEVALFASILLTLTLGITTAADHDRFFLLNFLGSLAALLGARSLYKRRTIFTICGMIWLSVLPLLLAFHLLDHTVWSSTFVHDLLGGSLFMIFSALFALAFLTIVESLFPVVTEMTLMEYLDPNHPLLRRLIVEAPGTYQHSLVVGHLAESAARAIRANGLFCRASTLYHDIGKLFNPHYFSENQQGGLDIHQLLSPSESAHVILAHIAEGEALARKHRLPESFIDIIREHHGTTLTYYFYWKQVELMQGDTEKVEKKKFAYVGPKPRTKESAIIMIADTLEAASRTLEEATEEAITEMVEKLIHEKIEEGQLQDCPLSFSELEAVKKSFVHTLSLARHLRVKYPCKV